REQLLAGLAALAQDSPHSAVVTGTAADDVRPVFVFPGQGTQWAGMAVGLAADFPVFAEHLRRCDEALAPLTGWSVLDVLRTENDAPPLAGSEVIQPVLFAVMVSLAALWRSFGVQPEAVLGHSQGEIAAACSAGALSIDEAARIVLLRSRALTKLTGTGGMLALAVPADRATELIAPYAEQLWVAIVNGPENTVVAGDVDALDTLAEHCSEHGVRARRVAIDYAAHTPHVEAVQADLLADLAGTTPRPTDIAVCSSATGGFVDPAELTAAFWYFGLRHPVRFDESVRSCVGDGTPLFIEVSPHPALIGHVQDTLLAAGLAGQAIGSLRRDDGGAARFLGALGQAFVAGAAVDWAAVLGSPSVPPAGLPTYQFEHRRYWIEPPTRTVDPGLTGAAACHPAITAVVQVGGDDGVLVSATVSARTQPWLDQHVIGHSVLLPGTAFVELALVAGEAAGCDLLEDLTLELPLMLPDSGEVDVPLQLLVGAPREDGRRSVAVHSRRPDGPGWIRHATGTLGIDRAPTGPSAPWPPPGTSEIDVTGLYDDLLARGYDYGPAFQGVLAARRDDEGRWVEVALPEPAAADAERYLLHPALLDAALHLLVPDAGDLLLPFAWRGVRVSAAGAGSLRVRLVRTGGDRAALTGYDGAGNPVVHIDELVLRAVPRQLDRPSEDLTPYRVEWVELPGSDAAADPLVWSVVDADGQGAGLTAALERAGARVTVCYDLPSVADLTSGDVPDVVLVPVLPDADLSDVGYQVRETVYAALDLVQGWLGDPRFAASRLVFLTAGAVTAAAPGGLVSAPLWGLVRSA
ncbi:MAG: acyltransferase domain-containing protein, partial [Geodermatophilaceae bacterium]|nr:acyltransferase domain-containing protein [Geodermatophilaceae bacterium]